MRGEMILRLQPGTRVLRGFRHSGGGRGDNYALPRVLSVLSGLCGLCGRPRQPLA